ncbi:hypothetical protein ABW19_dt0204324 [Dactylella cylindrospora]|nr:hypothetical protein ABW19_dt0204324 [Dactylella cylindrospora]
MSPGGDNDVASGTALTAEEEAMIRQQRADLDNDRIARLPLGDRQPGRGGRPGPYQARFGGPGDARIILGRRPGAPNTNAAPQGPAVGTTRKVEERWAALYNEELEPFHKEGLGEGDLYRKRENFNPVRRRSFSGGDERKIGGGGPRAAKNPVLPSPFRQGPGGNNNIGIGIGGRGGRTQASKLQAPKQNQPFNRPIQANRPPRAANTGDRKWDVKLVTNQGDFFDAMTANTGLRVPAGVNPRAAQQRPLAKPMASVKDLSPDSRPTLPPGFVAPHLRAARKALGEKAGKVAEEAPKVILSTKAGAPDPKSLKARSPGPPKPIKDFTQTAQGRNIAPSVAASSSVSGEDKSWSKEFLNLIAKPLFGDLLADYEDANQQLVFLSRYYSLNHDEWEDVRLNGPPSREKIAQISQLSVAEMQRVLAEANSRRRQGEQTGVNYQSRKREEFERQELEKAQGVEVGKTVPAPVSSAPLIDIDTSDEAVPTSTGSLMDIDVSDKAIQEWAGRIKEDHFKKMLQSLKYRLQGEKDSRASLVLYDKMARLVHGSESSPIYSSSSEGSPERLTQQLDALSLATELQKVVSQETPEPSKEAKELSPLSKYVGEYESTEASDDENTKGVKPSQEERQGPALAPPETLPETSSGSNISLQPPVVSFNNDPRLNRFNRPAASPMEMVSIPRETSDERRLREKRERMAAIDKEFRLRRQLEQNAARISAQGAAGQAPILRKAQEDKEKMGSDTDLIDLSGSEMSFNEKLHIDTIRSAGISEARKNVSEVMLKEAQQNQGLAEASHLDLLVLGVDPNDLDGLIEKVYNADELIAHLPLLSPEQLEKQRATNRNSVPALAKQAPWTMNVCLNPTSVGEKPVVVRLLCTDEMPLSFVASVRDMVGPDEWPQVARHKDFHNIVMDTTKKFYGKMAVKWGHQFAYGLGK